MAKISAENAKFLHFFGYASSPEGHEPNPTGFFEFDQSRDEKLSESYYQFKQLNTWNLKKVTSSAVTQTYANYNGSMQNSKVNADNATAPALEMARRLLYSETEKRQM